jgi:ankyrin repeat protein
VNAQDNDGNTVLWRAVFAARGRTEIVRHLVEQGAKDDIPNNAGETPRQLAERLGTNVLDPVN